MKIIKKIKEARAGGVLLLKIGQFLKRLPYRFTDKEYYHRLRDIHTQECCTQTLHYLRKKYKKITLRRAHEIQENDAQLPHEHNKIIWICWLQGMKNAPEIVRMCYQSIIDNFGDEYKINEIDSESFSKYISLPTNILNKYKKGYISQQWFADLVRFALLDQYGGTWMDATIFCSGGDIPKYVISSDLFVYQTLFPATWGIPTVLNSYFITACQNNKIIKLTKELFFDYWENNKYCGDYWLVNNFFEIAKDEFPDEWAHVVPFENLTMHILQARMKEQFDQEIFDDVVRRVPFHKLQWRFADENFDREGTYYQYMLTHFPIYYEENTEGQDVQK